MPRQVRPCVHLNRFLGTLLLLQLLHVNSIAMGRGGEIAFYFTGDMFRFRRAFGHTRVTREHPPVRAAQETEQDG